MSPCNQLPPTNSLPVWAPIVAYLTCYTYQHRNLTPLHTSLVGGTVSGLDHGLFVVSATGLGPGRRESDISEFRSSHGCKALSS